MCYVFPVHITRQNLACILIYTWHAPPKAREGQLPVVVLLITPVPNLTKIDSPA
jgi:hypothetical protein